MKTLKLALCLTTLCLAGAAVAQQASTAASQATASTYPNKPVTMIVAFPAGGGTDIVARRVAQGLTAAWGQSVIVENKGGAGGTIGTALTARAEPNGYTIMLATLGNMAINPHLYKMEIDPSKDLAAITNVVGVTFVLVAHPSLPANSVQELIALAKQKPGSCTFRTNYRSCGALRHNRAS